MKKLFANWDWKPPAQGGRITTVEMHTGGEPVRVFTSGLPVIEGRATGGVGRLVTPIIC